MVFLCGVLSIFLSALLRPCLALPPDDMLTDVFDYSVPVEHAFFSPSIRDPLRETDLKIPEPVYKPLGMLRVTDRHGSFVVENYTTDDLLSLQTCAKSNGIYYIRTPIRSPQLLSSESRQLSAKPIQKAEYAFNSLSAKQVLEARWSLNLVVSLSAQNSIEGLALSSGVGPVPPKASHETSRSSAGSSPAASLRPDFLVTLQRCLPGPAPDVDRFLEKVEREQAEQARKASEDNRGFLAKYWMYIVPFVIMAFMLSQSQGAQAQGGGGGGG